MAFHAQHMDICHPHGITLGRNGRKIDRSLSLTRTPLGSHISTLVSHGVLHSVTHMTRRLILASSSEIRAKLLRNANVEFSVERARVDEETIKSALLEVGAHPRDIADALAEAKARKIAARQPEALVIGCDQVLGFKDRILGKPDDPDMAVEQLRQLRGGTHHLYSAAVLYEDGAPVWRHVGQVRLTMRDFSDVYLTDYVARNWDSIRWSVGGYKLEEEGVRLFTRIEGDYFNVLGMPLLELLSYLTLRGTLQA